jgi:hypothetical protein
VTQKSNLCGGPPIWLSGWITGFWFWDQDGGAVGQSDSGGLLKLDNVTYPLVDIRKIPVGDARAPFNMRDFNNTSRYEAFVMAGTLGKKITKGAPEGYAAALTRAGVKEVSTIAAANQSTLQPMSAWALYGPYPHNATGVSKLRSSDVSELVTLLNCPAA